MENKESKTATFAEMVLKIDNERWQGVPWILKSAKAIEEDIMRVIVHLKPHEDSFTPLYEGTKPSALVFELFETKKVYFSINSRKPGFVGGPTRSKVVLDWDSEEAQKEGKSLDPYAVVIGEAIRGREENCKFGLEEGRVA